jgi:uncharacterized protein involved in exopolysaccharide biosynthesis
MAIGLAAIVYLLTENQQQSYKSEALVYTGIASGYDIEATEQQRVDFFGVNNAFDNLINIAKSQQTLEKTAIKLLALHLQLSKPQQEILGPIPFNNLHTRLPAGFREKHLVPGDISQTADRLQHSLDTGSVFLNNLIFKSQTPYGLKTLERVKVVRQSNSDMVKFMYEYPNAEICHSTLKFMVEVFVARYKNLRKSQTSDVVSYFEERLAEARNELKTAEDNLTFFRSRNQIINYTEQTKFIASKKQDALEHYTQERMDLVASKAVMDSLERRLNKKDVILSTNSTMIDQRNELAELQKKIAFLKIEGSGPSEIKQLEIQSENIRDQISDRIVENYKLTHSKEGVRIEQLLDAWLDNLVKVSEQQARIQLYEDRLKDINEQYDIYAPLGSTLSRLEREIDVAERAYLEVLHGLNLAKIREQNIKMSNNLKIIDPPEYPREPEPSKRMLLVILAFLIGGGGCFSVLLAIELLDNTLKRPIKAEKDTGLHVLSAFPVISKKTHRKFPGLMKLLRQNFFSRLKLNSKSSQLFQIGIYSHYPLEGKTTLVEQLQQVINEKASQMSNGHDSNGSEEKTVSHKLDNVILVEFPAVFKEGFQVELMKSCDQNVLVARADRSWEVADKRMLEDYREQFENEPYLFLNGVKSHELEQLIGDLPKKRSRLRRWLKRVLQFEFSKNKFP